MAERKLKTVVTAETSNFKKGMRESKAALADFQKQGQRSLSEIASNLGGASGALGTLNSNITNATSLFRGLFRQSEAGLTTMRSSIAAVGGALAGLGITAAIMAFRELNAEAANFEQRLKGVNIAQAAQAARDTYKQSLYDQTGRGEDVAMTKEYWQTRLSMGWASLTTGASKEERDKAMRAAEEAARLASERVDLQRQLDQSVVAQAATQARINELSNVARDNSKTLAERSEARSQAEVLTNQLYDRQIMLQSRLADNWRQTNAIVSSTDEEMRQQYQAEAAVHNLEGQRQSALRTLIRMNNTLSNSAKSHADSAKETQKATELTLAAATELVNKERELAELTKQNDLAKAAARFRMDGALPTITTPGSLQGSAQTLAISVPIKPVVDTEAAQAAIVELSGVIESGVAGMSEAIGTLIGDLINGENAWGNFAQAGISVVADMLSTVGKAFITEGVGVIAAKAALTSGNGVAAIAAGSAMVALAATMKTAMSNAAANWGGSSGSVATSSYSSGTSSGVTAFGREMNIKVSGTLTANGSKLVAVLNNENDRRNYTT